MFIFQFYATGWTKEKNCLTFWVINLTGINFYYQKKYIINYTPLNKRKISFRETCEDDDKDLIS